MMRLLVVVALMFCSFCIVTTNSHNFFDQISHANKCASQYGTLIVARSSRDKSAVVISVSLADNKQIRSQDSISSTTTHGEIFCRLGKRTALSIVGLPVDVSLLSRKGFALNEQHLIQYDTQMKPRRLFSSLSSFVHAQTLSLHQRPLAVHAAMIDFEEGSIPTIYECDNIGNIYECECTCIGKHAEVIMESLRRRVSRLTRGKSEDGSELRHLSASKFINCCLHAVEQAAEKKGLHAISEFVIFDANGKIMNQMSVCADDNDDKQ